MTNIAKTNEYYYYKHGNSIITVSRHYSAVKAYKRAVKKLSGLL